MFNPSLGDLDIFRVLLDADEAEALQHRSAASRARPHERVKDYAIGRGDKSAQIAHEGDRFHGRMTVLLGFIGCPPFWFFAFTNPITSVYL